MIPAFLLANEIFGLTNQGLKRHQNEDRLCIDGWCSNNNAREVRSTKGCSFFHTFLVCDGIGSGYATQEIVREVVSEFTRKRWLLRWGALPKRMETLFTRIQKHVLSVLQ